MTSFQIGIRPNRRAAARYIAHVRRTLQRVLAEEQKKSGITQSDIARALDIHRSIISKELSGRKDISLGRVAEYAYALGREISFNLPVPKAAHGDNKPVNIGGVKIEAPTTSSDPSSSVEVYIKQAPFIPTSANA